MNRIPFPGLGFVRSLGLAAAATLMLSLAASQRTEAMSPINPGPAPLAQRASDELPIPVRGHGGHGGGGWHGGGGHWHGGGGHWHGGGGWHGGGWHHGRFAHFHHRRHFFGGYHPYYSTNYYPSYYHYPRRCRVVWTHWGPRRVCYRRHWHRRYWY